MELPTGMAQIYAHLPTTAELLWLVLLKWNVSTTSYSDEHGPFHKIICIGDVVDVVQHRVGNVGMCFNYSLNTMCEIVSKTLIGLRADNYCWVNNIIIFHWHDSPSACTTYNQPISRSMVWWLICGLVSHTRVDCMLSFILAPPNHFG